MAFIRKTRYGNKSLDMALDGKEVNPLRRSLSYLRCDWSLHNQHSYVSCHLLFDSNSKSAAAFKHRIPFPTPLYILPSPSGQSSKYSVIRCKERFWSIPPKKLRYVLFHLNSVVVVFSHRNRFVVTTTYL